MPTRAWSLGTALGEHSLLLDPSWHMYCVLTWDGFTLISSDHHKQQHFWPFCFLSWLFWRSHTLIYTRSVLCFCFLLFLHLITCCMADYQKLPSFIPESISQPQPQSSPPTEGTNVQVLAHSVCRVTVLNNNVTNTLNYTVISMMKIMSTVNCLGPWLLCSPCWEVQLLKAVLHDNIAKILIARQGDEWQACAAQLKLFQFTLSVKFAVYNKHLCLFWRE